MYAADARLETAELTWTHLYPWYPAFTRGIEPAKGLTLRSVVIEWMASNPRARVCYVRLCKSRMRGMLQRSYAPYRTAAYMLRDMQTSFCLPIHSMQARSFGRAFYNLDT